MVSLHDVLVALYPAANPVKDWLVQDDGAGPRIVQWTNALGAQPTQADIDAATPAAQAAADARAAALAARDADKAALKTAYSNAVTRLQQINATSAPTNAQVIQAVRDMAQIQLQIMHVVKALT